jgi:hypothetical protein
MNGQSNNAKQFRCNSFFIRLGDKAVFLVFTLGIISLLNACESKPNPNEPPVRLSGLSYQDTTHIAYIWTSGSTWDGSIGQNYDYATITRIDDINVPDEYLPEEGKFPYYTWLLEIPVGKHTVEILLKERGFWSGATETSRQTLTFKAKPYQIYHPFTNVSCSREYFWIEHFASNSERADYGPVTVQWIMRHTLNMKYMRVSRRYNLAAGERPNQKPCE